MGGSRQSPLTTHRIGIVWYEFHTRHCANVSIVWWNANNCCFDKAISNVLFGFIIVVILLRTGTTIGRNGFRTIICNTWYISAILIWITWDAQLQIDAKVVCILKVGFFHYYTLWKILSLLLMKVVNVGYRIKITFIWIQRIANVPLEFVAVPFEKFASGGYVIIPSRRQCIWHETGTWGMLQ